MYKKIALLFAAVFLAVGILGFVPGIAPKDDMGMRMLLGIFMVGAVHNIIHLASGVAALIASKSNEYAKMYFKIFGLVYLLVTIIGLIQKDTVLGLIDINAADNVLHIVISAVTLFLGFGDPFKSKTVSAR